jgi:hypothetical protein
VSTTSDLDSAGWVAAQVGQVVYAALLRNRTQSSPRGREEPAYQSAATALELLQPRLPVIRAATNDYRNEATLDPLQSRDDFRLLMMDLAMPANPFGAAR